MTKKFSFPPCSIPPTASVDFSLITCYLFFLLNIFSLIFSVIAERQAKLNILQHLCISFEFFLILIFVSQ